MEKAKNYIAVAVVFLLLIALCAALWMIWFPPGNAQDPNGEHDSTADVSPAPSLPDDPSPSATETPDPEPSVSVTPDPEPSVSVTPDPEPSVSVDPDPEPSVSVTPDPEPSVSVTPDPEPSVSVTPDPEPSVSVTPDPEPSVSVTPDPEPSVSVTPDPEPSVSVTPDPEPSVSVTPDPEPSVSVTPDPEPSVSVTPDPEPSVSVTPDPEPTPSVSKPSGTGVTVLSTVASGTAVKSNDRAIIDYSNVADGYVMVKYTESTSSRLKVQVIGPTTTYTYNITVGEWAVFPLSDGNGSYKIAVYINTTGNKYATVLSVSCPVTLKDDFAPFLRPNQYVNYADAKKTLNKAAQLTASTTDTMEVVEIVYNYVIDTLSYDREKAENLKSGYLPDLDAVLSAKKGICSDYAALMTAMLRAKGIPCKLVVGYAGTAYHAWIHVWSEESGWITNAIYFDGNQWNRMDPTFASSSNSDPDIMDYIGDGSNYTVKYVY